MTTSANGITIPEKTGYKFNGYYTSTNGAGTKVIDENGKITSVSTTQFNANTTIYASWTRVMAENIGYTAPSGVDCSDTQCMIDYIYGLLN